MSNAIRRYGILLKVNDMDTCRAFYRDLLGLGEPIADSNNWVEFAVTPEMILILERSKAKYLEHESSATSWVYECERPLEKAEELLDYGYDVEAMHGIRQGGRFYRCLDPEKNVFYLTDSLMP